MSQPDFDDLPRDPKRSSRSPRPSRPPLAFATFLKRALLITFGLLLAIGLSGGLYIWSFLGKPGSLPPRNVELVIPEDATFAAVSRELVQLGVISDTRRFTLLAEWNKQTGKLRMGRYLVNTGWGPQQVLEHLVSGAPVLDRITLPEGLAWWEIGRRLERAGFVRFDDFKKIVHDPEFLRRWGIPLASAEGYLFPDTYLIMRPLTLDEKSARSVVGRLVDTFWRRYGGLRETGIPIDTDERRRIAEQLILASIVEKETSVPVERARVAGVYANRIRIKMPLQADPTTIYGIGPSFSGRLRRVDLNNKQNLYNTYQHPGMPPGPICSPGLAAIRAAIAPEEHDYLYFVAKGDGGHAFNTDLAGHNRAVRMYITNKD